MPTTAPTIHPRAAIRHTVAANLMHAIAKVFAFSGPSLTLPTGASVISVQNISGSAIYQTPGDYTVAAGVMTQTSGGHMAAGQSVYLTYYVGAASYPTDCGARVFPTRVEPLLTKTLPAIAVYTVEEPVDLKDSSSWNDPDNPGILKRKLSVAVEIVAAGERSDDSLDALALQVEAVMDADPTLGETVEYLILSSTEIAYFDKGDRLIGSGLLIYEVTYRTKSITETPTLGVVPTTVYGSWSPDIGTANQPDYLEIAGPDPGSAPPPLSTP